MKKFLLNFYLLTISILIVLISSCTKKHECGFIKWDNHYTEYFLCDSLLNQDTIRLDPHIEVDSIKLILPKHHRIVDARQSFIIRPSIWSEKSDHGGQYHVGQYITLENLEAHCIRKESILTNNDTILNPMRIDQRLIDELYFNEKSEISKKQLLNSIQHIWFGNDHARKTYIKYLRNYTTWKNAPNWNNLDSDNPNFELLATTRYLTVSIQNEQHVKDITFRYSPIFGN